MSKYDERIDVWALGVIFLEVLRKNFKIKPRVPFYGEFCGSYSPL